MTTPGPILTPDCPVCGHPPALALGHQSWCGNSECKAITWNPLITPAANRANVKHHRFGPEGEAE